MHRKLVLLLSLPSLAALVALSGCASSGPAVDAQMTQAIEQSGVPQQTYQKVYNGRPLDYQDILNMVQKNVSPHYITSYLQSTQKVYNFSYAQLQTLKKAGASPQLLNYLTETQGFYGTNTPAQLASTEKRQKGDSYYHASNYLLKSPFWYNPPLIDDWYNSAYEESLYSPFSFN